MSANDVQVGGDHYKAKGKLEHWDIVAQHDLDYFQGQITKYVMRWKKKGGLQDLKKAQHFLEKYIELEQTKQVAAENEKRAWGMQNMAGAAQIAPYPDNPSYGHAAPTPKAY